MAMRLPPQPRRLEDEARTAADGPRTIRSDNAHGNDAADGVGAGDAPWSAQLRRWRDEEQHWTQEQLVDEIVRLAFVRKEERGIRCDIRHVRRWESGEVQRPQAVYRRLLSELGAPLPPPQTAVISEPPAVIVEVVDSARDVVADGTDYPTSPDRSVDLLDELTRADLTDDSTVMTAAWAPDATPKVITGYLFGDSLWVPGAVVAGTTPGSVAGRISATVRGITDLDFRFGGGHVRGMLLSYWKSEIMPELRRAHPASVRKEVFSAAADAAEVLGWSAYDDGRHGAAQRYFIQGLRLAHEAGDHLMGGQILSNLSHQANYLGRFDDAVKLARAAQSATMGKAAGTVESMFLAMEARALASVGDERGCIAALTQAERAFERRQVNSDPDWIGYFDELELAGEAAHCFRDLGRPVETLRFAAQAIDPIRTPPRTRSFISMVTAAGELRAGNADAALALATEAVNLAGCIKSDRYRTYVRDFHQSIEHIKSAESATFTELVRSRHRSDN